MKPRNIYQKQPYNNAAHVQYTLVKA